ncbi:MAG: histidine phosphatase family protein [Ramlibacter sp.]
MKLWLARHAQPVGGEGLCYGATDLPADEAQTLEASTRLAEQLPAGIDVRCSPLKRCVQMCEPLRLLRPELRIHPDVRLAEMCFGSWEGRLWSAIEPAAMQAWTDDFEHHRPGGGESVHEFMARVAQLFDEARTGGTDTLWITHAGVIRAANLLASNRRHCASAAQWPAPAPAFGQWEVLTLDSAATA